MAPRARHRFVVLFPAGMLALVLPGLQWEQGMQQTAGSEVALCGQVTQVAHTAQLNLQIESSIDARDHVHLLLFAPKPACSCSINVSDLLSVLEWGPSSPQCDCLEQNILLEVADEGLLAIALDNYMLYMFTLYKYFNV